MNRKDIIKIYKHILDKVINKIYVSRKNKSGRKQKFNNFTYIKHIFYILFFGYKWDNMPKPYGLCRSAVEKKFRSWNKLGVFFIAYNELLNEYCKHRIIKKLFVDSTCIQNMNCSDKLIDYYYKIKSKTQLKVSIISADNNIPLCYTIGIPKDHDVKHVPILVKSLKKNKKLHLHKNAKIIGDKGYVSNSSYKIKKSKITIVYPKRKNQKKKNSKEQIRFLSERYKVEQTFSHLKRTYNRLSIIYDRKIETFNIWLIMAFTCQIIRKIR